MSFFSEQFLQRMALSFSSRYLFFFLLASFLLSTARFLDAKSPLSFTFERFEKNRTSDSEIALYGDAEISNSTVVSRSGRVAYINPIIFSGTSPGFSTYFSFSINGGTLAFFLVPNSGSPSTPAILKVVFGSNVEIGVGSRVSIQTSNLSALGLVMRNGEKLHSWIDYDGDLKRVEVRLSKWRASRPSRSLISYPVDLSSVLWREEMLVCIGSWYRRNSTKISSVLYSWSFVVNHGAPYTMHSEPLEPLDPYSFSLKSHEDTPVHVRRNKNPWKIAVALVIGAALGALVASFVFYLRSKAIERHPVTPLEYPEHPVEIAHGKVAAGGVMNGDKEKA